MVVEESLLKALLSLLDNLFHQQYDYYCKLKRYWRRNGRPAGIPTNNESILYVA